MIKRTLFFGNAAYLSTKNEQLVVSYPDKEQRPISVPIEDIGIVVVEHLQITVYKRLNRKTISK